MIDISIFLFLPDLFNFSLLLIILVLIKIPSFLLFIGSSSFRYFSTQMWTINWVRVCTYKKPYDELFPLIMNYSSLLWIAPLHNCMITSCSTAIVYSHFRISNKYYGQLTKRHWFFVGYISLKLQLSKFCTINF